MSPSDVGAVRHRLTVLALAFTLLAAACSGSDSTSEGDSSSVAADDSSTEDTSTDDSAAASTDDSSTDSTEDSASESEDSEDSAESDEPLTASYRGITETEIHIGVAMLDFDALKEFKLVEEGWGDQIVVYNALIDEINSRGGIHGRMIVPHFEHYSPLGSTEAEAACTALTKDIETFAVLGGFQGPAEVANTCVVDINATVLIGGVQTAERLAVAQAPWVVVGASAGRVLQSMMSVLDQDGRVAGRQVAVVGAVDREEVFDSASDILSEFGVSPVIEIFNDAPAGDVPATDARWEIIAENIRASGADTVLLIGSTQGGLRGIKAAGLDVEVWAADATGLENLGRETTAEDADGALTVVALTDNQQWNHETMAPCRAIVAAAVPELPSKDPNDHVDGEERWYKSVHSYCRLVGAMETLLVGAGRNPTQDSLYAAIDNYGDGSLPGMPYVSLGPGKSDLNDTFQLAQYDVNEGEAGGLVSISDPVDVTP
ncbi:MAG: ABC transporter substrate-binding protein [Acidimicrobiales bacterium]|nr:ABC transporter substrate-binding protein [Acidimicrobiales bacterium]MDG2217522.1 ABC transporter substrate-binding protein [Acidimicrobiales bacterium]